MERPKEGPGEGFLLEALAQVPGAHSRHGRRHPLGSILALAVCAMLSGARSMTAKAQRGRDHGSAMSQALGCTSECFYPA